MWTKKDGDSISDLGWASLASHEGRGPMRLERLLGHGSGQTWCLAERGACKRRGGVRDGPQDPGIVCRTVLVPFPEKGRGCQAGFGHVELGAMRRP